MFRNSVCCYLKTLLKTQTKTFSQLQLRLVILEDAQNEFTKVYPQLLTALTDTDLPQVNKRLARIIESNVRNSKKNFGKAVPLFYSTLLEDLSLLTPQNVKLANILGWCLELNQTFLVMQDDIFDGSESRKGLASWYKQEDVGMTAINDSTLLENAAYLILKKHFSELPCYIKLMECFHDCTFKTAMGQRLEGIFKKATIASFTMDKYETLVKYKLEPYVFRFPVYLAMYLAETFDQKTQIQLAPIFKTMGLLIQASNDFLDSFGDPAITGKEGTDIKSNTFTWLITVALEKASFTQRNVLVENYGKDCPEAVAKVNRIYGELNMPMVFENYEKQKLRFMRNHIEQISGVFPHKLFLEYLMNILSPEHWREKMLWYF